ncbi:hypothetical protein CWN04_26590, partial [Klebsiella michiganensis]
YECMTIQHFAANSSNSFWAASGAGDERKSAQTQAWPGAQERNFPLYFCDYHHPLKLNLFISMH